jgi:signal peptidase I
MHAKEQKSKYTVLMKIIISFSGILAGFLISRIFFTPFILNNNSMLPNLKKGDYTLILRHISPKKNEIFLIQSPLEPDKVILKRIIALNGDTIEIKNKILFINNIKIEIEKIKSTDTRIFPEKFTYRDNMPLIKLDEGEYFILGDNIDFSNDSRTFGIIDEDLLIGKMIYKF